MASEKLIASAIAALLFLCVMVSVAQTASIEALYSEIDKLPPQQRQKRLEDGARKEGAFVHYSVSNAELINAYVKAFMNREQYDKDGYFHADSLGIATIAYNHQLVKKEEAPKTYNDLLDPKWKGSLTIDLEPERALTAWLLAWGEAKTREFVQKLLTNGTSVRRGHTLQAQLLCAGEFKIAVEIYPDAILRMKKNGCPATIVFANPTPAVVGGNYAIYVNTLHPNAAALFIDFALSAEGSKILAGTGRVHRRKGVKSFYEELSDLDEKGVPLLIITPEQTEEVTKPMEKIMKELLVP